MNGEVSVDASKPGTRRPERSPDSTTMPFSGRRSNGEYMVEEVTPEELHERIESGNAPQVIDIRHPKEFEAGHIPGAENVPFPLLTAEIDRVTWDDEIVVACPIGQSSLQAARLIESYEGVDADATVANLTGGYDAWEYELESR